MFKYNKEIVFSAGDSSSHGIISSLVSGGESVLEFGCAKGELSAHLKNELGCKTYGIEISEKALEIAKANLDGYVCCDIENYEWEKSFDVEFDTLIFADVLEHLRDPAKAIRRALSLLKDDGKIIFSVPNIAHADIILKLINNRFDYSEIGLLDDTHIHFFAKENLVDFCTEAKIFPTLITGTLCPAGSSEQAIEDKSSASFRASYMHDYSSVYQFVVCAIKSDFASGNDIETVWALDFARRFTKIYLDEGNGISEDNTLTYPLTDGEFSFGFDVKEGLKAIRIDPCEDSGYFVRGLEITVDGDFVAPSKLVGIDVIEDSLYLLGNDPQIHVDIPSGAKRVEIKGSISCIFTDSDPLALPCSLIDYCKRAISENKLLLLRLNEISECLNETSKNLELVRKIVEDKQNHILNLEDIIATLKAENELTHASLARANTEISRLDSYLGEVKKELDHYKTHYFVAISQREDLKRQLADITNKYNVISNAGWWKITKPFRVLFDIIKYPFKHGPFLKIKKFFKVWREQGFRCAWRKVFRKKNVKKANAPLFTEAQIKAQREHKFDRDIKFSVIVPLFNTPEAYLKEMIESVIKQTYSNWELCLADGSDDKHAYVESVVKKYARHDSRIKYTKLEKNLGISGNTNACLDISTGDYITLFDHDDLLHESALYCVMEAICDKGADFIYTDENTFQKTPADAYHPHFKPDFSPDTLRSYNYICHLTTFSRELYEIVGGFRSEFDGSQDYDMILRLTEKAKSIVHIPKILYYWRCHKASVASDISAKPYTLVAAKKALDEHLVRIGLSGKSEDTRIPSVYKINYDIQGEPLVSIIIANKDYISDLDKCITSILERSTYKNYEIIVVENNSTDPDTFKYYDMISAKDDRVKVIYWEGKGFNYSSINNYGFEVAKGEHIILLNNDIEILTPSWIEEMLMFSQRSDVGAVGAMLYYPDDTIQHAGVIIGIGGDPEMAVAGHSHKYFKRGEYGYASRLCLAQNLSAVTAACVMIRSEVFKKVNGLDKSYAVAFNDVDLCLKIRQAGYLIVWTPFAEAYHYESKSRGLETTPEKVARFNSEINNFLSKWRGVRDAGDPYYNPNLTLEREDFGIK